MAVTAGRTWATTSTVASATPTVAFRSTEQAVLDGGAASNGNPFKCVRFIVDAASAAPLQVNIPWLHGTDYFSIPIGATQDFVTITDGPSRTPRGHIITVQGSGGTATFSGGIIA